MKLKSLFGFLTIALVLLTLLAASPWVTATAQGNWWDKFGEPQYGGTITCRLSTLIDNFDPWVFVGGDFLMWFENLLTESWTVSKDEWPLIRTANYYPLKYVVPNLAESWEKTDPQTLVLSLRKGIHWQDKLPVKGREFTAEDVVYHYNRILGMGSGFDKPSPFAVDRLKTIASVSAIDKYTVVIKFKSAGLNGFMELQNQGVHNFIEPRESVEAGIKDWKNAVGTGAWILKDYVSGGSVILDKNQNYWGFDERYPKNRLPYADTLKAVVIPDLSTALAALRTGKIDIMTGRANVPWQQAQSLANSNPELKQAKFPAMSLALDLRVDKKPFSDIRVRKALQMALDRKTIARSFYGGTADEDAAGLLSPICYKGIAVPYKQWPKDLQEEYGYNPEKAKQLLAEAGYPNGFKTKVHASVINDLQLLQGMKSYFMDIGVDMEIEAMDPPIHRSFIVSMKHEQMAAFGFAFPWPPEIVSTAKASFNKTSNFTGHRDTAFDALARKLDLVMTEAEVGQILRDLDMYYLRQHWTINTVPSYNFNIWQPYLKGYDGEGLAFNQWQFYTRFWIDHDLKKSMGL